MALLELLAALLAVVVEAELLVALLAVAVEAALLELLVALLVLHVLRHVVAIETLYCLVESRLAILAGFHHPIDLDWT